MVHRARTHLSCRRRRSCSVSTGRPPSRRRPAGSRAPLMVNVMGDVGGGTFVEAAAEAGHPSPAAEGEPLELVVSLCRMLAAEGVDYVHWKSNEALSRSLTG